MIEFFEKAAKVSMCVGFGMILAVVVLFQPVLANVDASDPNVPRIICLFCLFGGAGAFTILLGPLVCNFCADVAYLIEKRRDRQKLLTQER